MFDTRRVRLCHHACSHPDCRRLDGMGTRMRDCQRPADWSVERDDGMASYYCLDCSARWRVSYRCEGARVFIPSSDGDVGFEYTKIYETIGEVSGCLIAAG